MKCTSFVCTTIGLLMFGALAAAQALPGREVTFDVAEQPLARALNTFADQSNLRIVFNARDTDGLVSQRLEGSFTPEVALRKILGEARLSFHFIDEHTVEVLGLDGSAMASGGMPGCQKMSFA